MDLSYGFWIAFRVQGNGFIDEKVLSRGKMKAVKNVSLALIAMAVCFIAGCKSTAVQASEFEVQAKVSVDVPSRFFTRLKADGAKNFSNDYRAGRFIFECSEEDDFVVMLDYEDGVMETTWGNQFLEVHKDIRSMVATAFISACYTMKDGGDGIDTAFKVLSKIFSDPMYVSLRQLLSKNLGGALEAYGNKSRWQKYKAAHFSTERNVIRITK